MPAGLGKFEGEPAETYLLWTASLEWQPDQVGGSTDGGVWHARFEGQIGPDDLQDYFQEARDYGYTDAEILGSVVRLYQCAGAILSEGPSGFVGSDLYGDVFGDSNHTSAQFEEDWEHYSAEEEEVEEA